MVITGCLTSELFLTDPIRYIHDFAHNISGCKLFSTIDLVKAYHQIPVCEEDIAKTAVTTPFGLYKFPFMTFSLRNAGQTFQKLFLKILKLLERVFLMIHKTYVNDNKPESYQSERGEKCKSSSKDVINRAYDVTLADHLFRRYECLILCVIEDLILLSLY